MTSVYLLQGPSSQPQEQQWKLAIAAAKTQVQGDTQWEIVL